MDPSCVRLFCGHWKNPVTFGKNVQQTIIFFKWQVHEVSLTSGKLIMFHQPGLCWNRGFPLPRLPFGGPKLVWGRYGYNLTRCLWFNWKFWHHFHVSKITPEECLISMEPRWCLHIMSTHRLWFPQKKRRNNWKLDCIGQSQGGLQTFSYYPCKIMQLEDAVF